MKDIFKNIYKNIIRYFIQEHRIIAIISVIILAGIIAVIVVCCSISARSGSHVTDSPLLLDDTYWRTDDNGFKYYDRDGFSSSYGIDISEWNDELDFKAIRKYGIEFVIMRVGYRGYETGKFVLDKNLSTYLRQAKNAGLKIGVYFVSQAINEEEAVEEAQYVLDHIRGYDIEMPVYIDLETVWDTARTDGLSADDYTKIASAFCKEIENNDLRAGIYANELWFNTKMDYKKLKQYDIWLAKYSDTPSVDFQINMWQFSSEGYIPNSDLWTDLNVRISVDLKKDNK